MIVHFQVLNIIFKLYSTSSRIIHLIKSKHSKTDWDMLECLLLIERNNCDSKTPYNANHSRLKSFVVFAD